MRDVDLGRSDHSRKEDREARDLQNRLGEFIGAFGFESFVRTLSTVCELQRENTDLELEDRLMLKKAEDACTDLYEYSRKLRTIRLFGSNTLSK